MSAYYPKYQSANLSHTEIIENFVVRTKEFDRVMADIRTTETGSSFQHYVFAGRRGAGKSTLLRRIQAEVCTNPDLDKRFIAVNLSEEQTGIYRLHDLWDYVIRDLQGKGHKIKDLDWEAFKDDPKAYTRQLYLLIHECLKKAKKHLILLIDNIDRILRNIGKEANLFRELLMNYNDVRIIGGSTIMSEQFWKYDLPFYQFFSIKKLKPLSFEEIKLLLTHWSTVKKLPKINELIQQQPGKIQAIRMLTDGTPRTMQLFVDMLLDRQLQKGYEYLQQIVDQATPIYQERLGQMSPQQQKIITELSFFWEAVQVEKLIPVCKMEGKLISAQLNKLAGLDIVEKIKGEKRSLFYRLEERFFNLWLLMTQGGPKQRREVKYLTAFIENWYDKDDFYSVYSNFLAGLKAGKWKPDYAASMTKAFAHSSYLMVEDRDLLITETRELPGMKDEWLMELPELAREIIDKAKIALSKYQFEKAISLLASIEQVHEGKARILSQLKELVTKFETGEKTYLDQINKGSTTAIEALAFHYYIYKQKPSEALLLAEKSIDYTTSLPFSQARLSLIHLWTGEMEHFSQHKQRLLDTLAKTEEEALSFYLQGLLEHKQYNFLLSQFQEGEHREMLKTKASPYYYAALLLVNSDHQNIQALPPELKEIVENITQYVRARQMST